MWMHVIQEHVVGLRASGSRTPTLRLWRPGNLTTVLFGLGVEPRNPCSLLYDGDGSSLAYRWWSMCTLTAWRSATPNPRTRTPSYEPPSGTQTMNPTYPTSTSGRVSTSTPRRTEQKRPTHDPEGGPSRPHTSSHFLTHSPCSALLSPQILDHSGNQKAVDVI